MQQVGLAYGVMDSPSMSIIWHMYRTKFLVLPVLLYGSETWTLNSDLKKKIDAFGIKCLHRIMVVRLGTRYKTCFQSIALH